MAIAIAALLGGLGQISIQWPSLRREGFRYRARVRSARPGPAPGAAADGAGHDRAGGDAGEPLRQHAARDESGDRRRVVADVCVPADVPADRPVRRVDRAPRCCRPSSRHAAVGDTAGIRDTVSRGLAHDADAERAGDARSAACSPRRSCELLFEHGRFLPADTAATAAAAAVLRRRPGRLFGGAHRVADLLRARQTAASPVARQRRRDRRQRRRERRAGRGRWVFGAWRSARRSRRSPTAPRWCCCCAGVSAVIDGRRLAVDAGQGHARASVVMAIAAVAIQHAMVRVVAGFAGSWSQLLRLARIHRGRHRGAGGHGARFCASMNSTTRRT